jgi:hypothetical protein
MEIFVRLWAGSWGQKLADLLLKSLRRANRASGYAFLQGNLIKGEEGG